MIILIEFNPLNSQKYFLNKKNIKHLFYRIIFIFEFKFLLYLNNIINQIV